MGELWEFRVLGPIEVRRDGTVLPIPAAKQRAVLASLLVDANRVVSVEQLISCLWAVPPQGARVTLQNYVMRLRRTLGDDGTLIVTKPTGYLITIGALDTQRFDELTSAARRLIANGDAAQAASLLREADDLWRGEPFADTASELLCREVLTGLAERRLTAREARIEADLMLGRHAEVATELRALTSRHPLRERFWAQLLLALYRSGRQAEALESYRDVSAVLAEELGVDPNPELRQLHHQILTADPTLTRTAAAPVPRQLPASPRGFTGRGREMDTLDDVAAQASTVVISTIGGMGGVGKTSLALQWAHQNADRFPDGQLYVNLRGFESTGDAVPPATALRGFLDALGVDAGGIPADLNSLVGLYRSMMADRRMLVFLDNASDTEQVVPLLPGNSSCRVLVTSRRRLGGLVTAHGAQPLTVEVFDRSDARRLLAARIGEAKLAAEPAATDELLDRCAGLPLALSIVAARAASHPDFQLAALAAELAEASARLDALDAGEVSANLRAAFTTSYVALNPATATTFCLLGLVPGPDISAAAAASLVGLPIGRTMAALRELEAAHLVQQLTPGRYRMHDLVRLYAREQVTDEQRVVALTRLVDFYTHTAFVGERRLDPLRIAIVLTEPAAGCVPDTLPDAAAAVEWFTTEHACLHATLRHCAAEGDHRATWQLAWSLGTFHWRRGHAADNLTIWRHAVAAEEALGDARYQAQAYRRLGIACARIDGDTEALDHLWRSLELATRVGEALVEAHTHHSIAWVWARRGDCMQALAHAEHGWKILRSTDNAVWEAEALNVLGWYHARAGYHEQGLDYCRSALDLCRQHGDREGQADTLDSLGYIAHHLGRHGEAVDYYRQALTMFDALGHTWEQANTLDGLGSAHHALGEHGAAALAWRQALRLFEAQHRVVDVQRVGEQLAALEQPVG